MGDLSNRPVLRSLALVILFTVTTRLEPLSSTVLDPDIWWHLRDGAAIVAQHAIPRQGWFTQYATHPWVDYSWGSEAIMLLFYRWWGLIGLVVLRSLLEVIITGTLFFILERGLGFWRAWFLSAAGMWAIHHCLGMQPMLLSIVMFTFELGLIFEALRRHAVGPLILLPPLFLLWANLHIQFVYGLFVLALLAAVRLVRIFLPDHWLTQLQPSQDLPLSPVLTVTGLSILSTLVNPYSWQLYRVIFHYVRSSIPYRIIIELQALDFRVPGHFVLVLILGAAFFTLGWRRSRDPFKLSLLLVCTLVGFRMTRDSWFSCIPALLLLSDSGSAGHSGAPKLDWRALSFVAATAVATAFTFTLVAWDSKTNNASLERKVAANFPANASAFVRAHSLQGPIYNDMNWGGYLIWALPERPVAIDNRPDLYGDNVLSRFYAVQQGWSDWRSDPDLNVAGFVLLNRRTPLTTLLAQDKRFHLVFADPLAVVFTRDAPNPGENHLTPPQGPQPQNRPPSP